MTLDDTDRAIVNLLQDGIAICERPFAAPAERLGLDEQALLDRLAALLDRGTLSRFGPMFDAERLGGAFTLCAMQVPAARFEQVATLLDRGTLSRFGPMFDAERLGGAFTLCAMQVPAARFEQVATLVNGYDEVAHNYEREHEYNMWFVLGAPSRERIDEVIEAIEAHTGLEVLDLPKLEEYYVGLRLEA